VIDVIIVSLLALGLGYALGINSTRSEPVKEEPKDFAYYKNLSESLLADVRRLREELRQANDKR
jgi:hypothetical protein